MAASRTLVLVLVTPTDVRVALTTILATFQWAILWKRV